MTGPHVDRAVAALAGRVQRLRASAPSQPRDVARKRELADGLYRLASLVAHGPSEVRRLLDSTVGEGGGADARKHAGNEIYALASQRESQGAGHNALTGVRAGWERGDDDLGLPTHRATLQQAVGLLELDAAIHPEPSGPGPTRACCCAWANTRPPLRPMAVPAAPTPAMRRQ